MKGVERIMKMVISADDNAHAFLGVVDGDAPLDTFDGVAEGVGEGIGDARIRDTELNC